MLLLETVEVWVLCMGAFVNRETLARAIRYGVVGGSVNLGLFGLYLALTEWASFIPLLATTLVYATGIALTYLGNAFWSFQSEKSHSYAAPRYVATYLAGYLIQAGLLLTLMRLLSLPHAIAQLIAMGAAAGTIFILLNTWVFAARQDQP